MSSILPRAKLRLAAAIHRRAEGERTLDLLDNERFPLTENRRQRVKFDGLALLYCALTGCH